MKAEKKQTKNNIVTEWFIVFILATAPWMFLTPLSIFFEARWPFKVAIVFTALSLLYHFIYFYAERRSFELNAVIQQARTGLGDIPRQVLSYNGLFGVHSVVQSRAIAGVTATLASMAEEPCVVVSRAYPFPEHCTREDLVLAIVFSCGIKNRSAERILDELVASLNEMLAKAQLHASASVEIFPIGLYESVTDETARFSSQSFVLERGYPELGRALKGFEFEHVNV